MIERPSGPVRAGDVDTQESQFGTRRTAGAGRMLNTEFNKRQIWGVEVSGSSGDKDTVALRGGAGTARGSD